MTTRRLVLALGLVAGCSSLGESGSVVALEIRTPASPFVEQDDTLQLHARALDQDGDSVAAAIVWLAADTTLTIVGADQLTSGLASGSGRVQARFGSLRSELVTYTIRRRADTLVVVGPARDTVDTQAGDSVSAPLVARLDSHGADTVALANSSIRFRVIDADTALARGRVEFTGGGLDRRVTTQATGAAVTLAVVAGATPPDSVRIEARAERPSGTVVPGSGQQFTVLFE